MINICNTRICVWAKSFAVILFMGILVSMIAQPVCAASGAKTYCHHGWAAYTRCWPTDCSIKEREVGPECGYRVVLDKREVGQEEPLVAYDFFVTIPVRERGELLSVAVDLTCTGGDAAAPPLLVVDVIDGVVYHMCSDPECYFELDNGRNEVSIPVGDLLPGISNEHGLVVGVIIINTSTTNTIEVNLHTACVEYK